MATLLLLLCLTSLSLPSIATSQSNLTSVNIGALYNFDSIIGRAAKLAIRLAIDDVNMDRTILPATKLNLITRDTNCSGFLATIEGPCLFCHFSLQFYFLLVHKQM